MPRLFRHVDDVALIGKEDRERANPVADLTFEDEPELRRLEVEVSLVVRTRLLRLAANDVGDGAVVGNEAPRLIGAGDDGVEVDIRLVARVVLSPCRRCGL